MALAKICAKCFHTYYQMLINFLTSLYVQDWHGFGAAVLHQRQLEVRLYTMWQAKNESASFNRVQATSQIFTHRGISLQLVL